MNPRNGRLDSAHLLGQPLTGGSWLELLAGIENVAAVLKRVLCSETGIGSCRIISAKECVMRVVTTEGERCEALVVNWYLERHYDPPVLLVDRQVLYPNEVEGWFMVASEEEEVADLLRGGYRELVGGYAQFLASYWLDQNVLSKETLDNLPQIDVAANTVERWKQGEEVSFDLFLEYCLALVAQAHRETPPKKPRKPRPRRRPTDEELAAEKITRLLAERRKRETGGASPSARADHPPEVSDD